MSLAGFADRAPFVLTVRCRTVANTLSIGFDVRRWSQCSAGKSKKASRASRSLVRQVTAFSYLAPYLSANMSMAASAAIDMFADKYGAKYEKAVTCLTKDREALLAFFDFPAEHWDHLRTSNPIESVFATVRHRTVRTKGALSAKTAKLMVFKLVSAAAKTWRRLRAKISCPKSSKASNSKTASRSSQCRLTTPPDRPRHPISRIAPTPPGHAAG